MANNNSGRDKNEKDLVCSFCGKHQDEVERMIIGPGVNICSECIGLCHDLLSDKPDQPKSARPARGANRAHIQPADDLDINILTPIPNAANVMEDKLPAFAVTANQSRQISRVKAELGDSYDWIDAEKVLDAHKDEAIYYHTDHHWTSLGAWYAFQGAKTQLGLDKSEEIKMKAYAVSDSFNGTLSAKSGYETDYKEPIYIYLPKSADAPQVAVNYVEEQKKSASMYDSSKLDERDQYSVFFGGNHAMIDIQSTQTEKRRLLVFKDSYANCFLPLLAPYYREIVVIDPRYYTGKLSSVMSDKQFDDVLFLYNANTFFEDRMLAGVLDEN